MLLFLIHCWRPQCSNSVPSIPKQCALSAVVTFHATPLIVTRTTPIPGENQYKIYHIDVNNYIYLFLFYFHYLFKEVLVHHYLRIKKIVSQDFLIKKEKLSFFNDSTRINWLSHRVKSPSSASACFWKFCQIFSFSEILFGFFIFFLVLRKCFIEKWQALVTSSSLLFTT